MAKVYWKGELWYMMKQETPPKRIEIGENPVLTPEAEEQQLIHLAYLRTKERLENGTASSQEIVHFLKMGSAQAQIENEKHRMEMELMQAKIESLEAMQRTESAYLDAINAFKLYSGAEDSEDDVDENV